MVMHLFAIEPGSPSLPKILQDWGYHTVLVGKWHLGIGNGQDPVDWNGHVGPGPLEVGFDHAFYIPATVDRVPCVFIENHKVFRHDPNDPIEVSYRHSLGDDPVARNHPELLKYTADEQHSDVIVNGIGRIGFMSGGHKARWVDEDITDVLAKQAREAIIERRDNPLFLLLGAHDPHKPHLSHSRFLGKSQCGRRGDSIVQFDWLVGQVLDALRDSGMEHDTFVFVTSDNGPAIYDGYNDGALETLGTHRPAGPLRGLKYSVYEGGCRVPGIVCWPGMIEPGKSEALISLLDLYATIPLVAGVDQLPKDAESDAIDFSEVLFGKVSQSHRKFLVLQGIGSAKSIVSRQWKYIPSTHTRHTSQHGPAHGKATRWADVPIYETSLYDLNSDVGEQENVIERYPGVAQTMRSELDGIISQE